MPIRIALRRMAVALGVLAMVGGAAAGGAAAQELGEPRQHPFISEMKAGALFHNIEDGDTVDVNVEVLFHALPLRTGSDILDWVLRPRPHLGFSVNTNDEESRIYGGISYDLPLGNRFFLSGGGGLAISNNVVEDPVPPGDDDADRPVLGSFWFFRGFAEAGFRLTERQSLSVIFEHSNASGIVDDSEGLNTLGLRYGLRF